MKTNYSGIRGRRTLLWLILVTFLPACSDSGDNRTPVAPISRVPGEIYLPKDSPKRTYIKTSMLDLSQRPLLAPLAGKIAYDESLTARISSPVLGRVVSKLTPLGQRVDEGTALVELDSPDVAVAVADFAKARADLTLASRAYNRQRELYSGKAAARKDVEQALDDLTHANSDVGRAEERLKNLHVTQQQADGRFALRSPLAGTVIERTINPGMEVRPDLATPLYVVSDISKLSVLIEIFEVDLPKIQLGQRVLITVAAYPDEAFPGTVKYIGQILDETTRAVVVRCALPNEQGKLLPGMYATVNVQSEPEDRVIVVPLTAVFTEDESDYAFVAINEDRYEKRALKVGLRLKDRAVIESGLQSGEQLVTEGALMLRTEEAVEENASDGTEQTEG